MVLVAVFGVALLMSGLAARTLLSTSLLFLLGGALDPIRLILAP
ncbi:hypothetical protein ACFV2Q_23075 [Streptomyces sp. NPDC059650]